MDRTTTVGGLKDLVRRFVRQRAWEQFHTPKNLAMGIAVEAAELMEVFQWVDGASSGDLLRRPQVRRAAQEELADVVIYCLAFANRAGLDIAGAVRFKLSQNRRKYPVRTSRGKAQP
ncbi:MAG: nucleotide pyrophosphohydrolase [Armatimonadota bacterium]|nr:nucleotide pyrophosphohydrolase [Armatimonadota bacterium]MDR7451710.1 nucleotide pyrophosphohydrolase [Armatimonadota bacterium]MDR7465672.1 nucleotide pyrophosphohydrolase [Armatimonadota bacterium]MDR7493581.1 nucleotide pyrophosphohydrolase [Armatimonadota bacterium]MDR7499515.1 nucleotide pyrophosphohydrolase [Armatimonadota bacterium]